MNITSQNAGHTDFSTQTTGLVLGKFLPPHLGHEYLIHFAEKFVDALTVIVGTLENEPIPGDLRFSWMKELFPNSNVVHLTDENPQHPAEHPDFWNIWLRSIRKFIPTGPDYVFASEEYGKKLAEILGAKFIPVDPERSIVPISATEVRNDPLGCWEYLSDCVRPYFTKKICIFGPESTGKSTLTENLAKHYQTKSVKEYARTYIETLDPPLNASDFENIARGQLASEKAILRGGQQIVFSDTDLLATILWAEEMLGECPEIIKELAKQQSYDLYLLLKPDVPWVGDKVRYLPHKSEEFFARCENILNELGRPYVVISGNWRQRFEAARTAVDEILKDQSTSWKQTA